MNSENLHVSYKAVVRLLETLYVNTDRGVKPVIIHNQTVKSERKSNYRCNMTKILFVNTDSLSHEGCKACKNTYENSEH